MSPWLNWLILLIGLFFTFIFWSWVPIERLDKYWRRNNEIGRPFLNTVIITGLPVLYAKLTSTPLGWLLIPICFFLTQYAVLSGRFLEKEKLVAGWVMLITMAAIWIAYFSF
jgi:hypothetical protein